MAAVGDKILAENANWSFGGGISKSFDEHVSKSVPLYDIGHDVVVKLADYFLYDGTVAYELGCSTGQLSKKLAERNQNKRVRIVGIDCEPEMIEVARDKCIGQTGLTFVCGDLLDFDFEQADLIIAYYTIQFVRPRYRQELFDRIYASLNWGGAFIMFEKVRAPDARFQDIMSTLYTDYKLDRGYTETEVVQKTRSLKGVLEPFSTQGNLDLMRRAGFVDVMTVMKYLCFEGFLAIK